MCGIFGYSSSKTDISSKLNVLRGSLNTLVHRGPDSGGEYYDHKVYLGHRRLSIIDLSVYANQPFKGSGNAIIVFNGEIYNYQELSRRFKLNLKTSSDTEVILEGYLRYGIEFFEYLRGIYAFSIYDLRKEPRLVLYRDLAGVKPLYYSKTNDFFTFASEIKALKHLQNKFSINESVLKSYLSLGYCIEPNTIYREIRSVEPGQCLQYCLDDGSVSISTVKRYNFNLSNGLSFQENKLKTNELLDQAVNRNLVADVSVSFSLSGGIDSSLIVAHGGSSNSKSISIRFNDSEYDESSTAMLFSKVVGVPLDVISIDQHSSIELLDKLFLHFDQPYSDSSAIPFYFLSREASKFSKVLIGGDGGDEIHNGYPSFSWLPWIHQFRDSLGLLLSLSQRFVSGSKRRKMNRLQDLAAFNNWDDVVCEWSSWIPPSSRFERKSPFLFDANDILDVFQESFNNVNVRGFQSSIVKNYFFKRLLSDYLRKADMMSMLNSLEYRVPMLDEDLVEFSLSIPYHQKSDCLRHKKILRSLHADIFPRNTSERKKSGFGIPLDRWLSINDFQYIESIVKRKDSIARQYIRNDYINFLFTSLFNPSDNSTISRGSVYQRILMLYSLELWYLKAY